MISDKVQSILHENINTYNRLSGKQYLLCFTVGKNREYSYVEIKIDDYNYWHLLGCKYINKGEDIDIYQECLDGNDIKQNFQLTHNIKNVFEKRDAFDKVFDFVKNAKYIRVGYIKPSPEVYDLYMALGNMDGVIGYSYSQSKDNKILFPKSCRLQRLGEVVSEQHKIVFVLSKPIGSEKYTSLEYEVKSDLAEDIIENHLPELKEVIDLKSGDSA